MASLTSCGHDCGLRLDAHREAVFIELPFAKTGMESRGMIMNEALGIKAVYAVREGGTASGLVSMPVFHSLLNEHSTQS